MSENKLILVFDVYSDGEYKGKHEFTEEAVAMGKSSNAALCVEHDSLNAIEVVFNVSDGQVRMSDLVGKSRPLLCNGLPVSSNVIVNNGDVINIGTVRLEVSLKSPQAEDVTQPQEVKPPAPSVAAPSIEEEKTDPGIEVAKTTTIATPVVAKEQPTTSDSEVALSKEEQPALDFVKTYSPKLSEQPTSGPTVLEVAQIFGEDVIDVKHFAKRSKSVTVGADTGFLFRFASQPVAWVPKPISKLAGLMYPFTEAHEEWKSDFFVPLEKPHNLFQVTKNGTYCNVEQGWSGYIEDGDNQKSFSDLVASNAAESTGSGYRIPIGENQRVCVEIGDIRFFAQKVPKAKKIASAFGKDIDFPFLLLLAFFGAFFVVVLMQVVQQPKPEISIEEQMDRFAEVLSQIEEPEDEPLPETQQEEANEDAGEGEKHKDEEGKIGDPESVKEQAKGDPIEVDQKTKDQESVSDLLGDLETGIAAEDGAMAGPDGLADSDGGLGGPVGAKGVQGGSGGFGLSGSGLGGGGTGSGMGMGNKGSGRGKYGTGKGSGFQGKKRKGAIGKIGGAPIVLGALDKSLIEKVIKKNINQIRYCYSRELNKNPNLAGKISIKFVISKDGTVAKASVKKSSMGNKKVEGCIAGRFKRFKFPKPKGNGIVLVTYPFVFQPG